MLNFSYVPALPAPYRPSSGTPTPPHVRSARRQDWPHIRSFLQGAGLSATGLAEHFGTMLVLERLSRVGTRHEILGCVAVEPGEPTLIRSLAVLPEELAQGSDALLLASALQMAGQSGATEAILIVETTAQLPAHHQGVVLWETLRRRCPCSKLVRELSNLDSMALAIRLPVPQVSESCAIA